MQNLLYRCIAKRADTLIHAQVHYVESQWRQRRQCCDLRVTSDFLLSPLHYICVTPTHNFRGERQRAPYEQHLSARALLCSGKDEGAEIKEGVGETKGGQRGAAPPCQRARLALLPHPPPSFARSPPLAAPALDTQDLSHLGAAKAAALSARGAAEIWSRWSQNRSLQSGLFNAC